MRDMVCPTCHKVRKTHKGKYHYTESGLQNVWLQGVEVFKCDCGEKFAFIPYVQELHKLIGMILLAKEDQLSGREIRFLRKHMGLRAKYFAKELGVGNVTVSRWENGESTPSESLDRFIRLFYATSMGFDEIAKSLVKDIFPKLKKGQKESPINFPVESLGQKAGQECVVN
ncbi:MAG: type II TA system antitoxin MqsA family protein [Desulfobaccales bacterium]